MRTGYVEIPTKFAKRLVNLTSLFKERRMALLSPVVVRPGNSPLDQTMRDIRSWLASERIQPIYFKTVVGGDGLGFEISFRDERDAERFQERFASLLLRAPITTGLQTGEVSAQLQFPRQAVRPANPPGRAFLGSRHFNRQ